MKYDSKTAQQFVDEMEEAGFEVEHYHGRFYWEGPMVRTHGRDEYLRAIRATTVRVQEDSLGLDGAVIYPVVGGRLVEEAVEA